MKLKIAKIAGLSVMSLLGVFILIIVSLFFRLSLGPLSLSFLNGRIEQAVNGQLTNMKVKLGDAVIELDSASRVPQIRFRNLVLTDEQGTVIASAPHAAVTLDGTDLLIGQIVVRSLDLIGPKIRARRNLDGTVQLGVAGQASAADAPTVIDENFSADAAGAKDAKPADDGQTSGAKLIELLDQRDPGTSLSSLEEIRISQAALSVYDDANAANWYAPSADLTFRKMPYGFVVLAKTDVATKTEPWHAEFSVTYRHDTKIFSISSTVDNLVPANVADKIFALSQFAKVKIPLSGHIDIEVGDGGIVTSANAELNAAAGQLNFPDYVAQPIKVDEGTLHVRYQPETGNFAILDSAVVFGGTRADLTGNVQPIRGVDGRLVSLGISLQAHNVKLGSKATTENPLLVDKIEFIGKAGIDDARLDVDDLVVMSGNTGVRMRGNITGGDESPAIHLAGRVRDISSDLLKTLWPPIIATQSRNWVTDNVASGRISEGTFQINLEANALAKAQAEKHLPDNAVDFAFSMRDVNTKYYKGLPLLTHANGEGHQHDNDFNLSLASGESKMESGETLTLNSGSFAVGDIMHSEVLGNFKFDISASVSSMLAFANHPDVNMMKAETNEFPNVQGQAHAIVGLSFPMIKDVPKELVKLTTDVSLGDVAVANIAPGIDLTEGNFAVVVSPDTIAVAGPAKVNGLAADITWAKPRNGGPVKSEVSATLDEKTREKLGLKLVEFMSGPMPVHALINKDQQGNTEVDVEADLANVKMKLAAVGYKRDATPGTKASFKFHSTAEGRSIDDFVLNGVGLHLSGNIKMTTKGKLQSVTMDKIALDDEENPFSARIVPGDGTYDLSLVGKNFDARPYIQNVISPVATSTAAPTSANEGQDLTVRAHFDHVTANRGEAIDAATAVVRVRAGHIAEASMTGNFLSGQPVTLNVTPLAKGREMRINTNDGGAALRAANFYSKIAGGQLNFYALIGNEEGSPVRNGQLEIKNFEVRNEAALAELDQRGKPKKSGPRKEGINFERIYLPFTIDADFVRLGNAVVKGPDMCATADGVIRKVDAAIDVTGTVIPACGLSGAFNKIPLFGELLSGGNSNEGMFGVTYAVGGTLSKPDVKINPISAIAPGIFRRFFDFSAKKPAGTKIN